MTPPVLTSSQRDQLMSRLGLDDPTTLDNLLLSQARNREAGRNYTLEEVFSLDLDSNPDGGDL